MSTKQSPKSFYALVGSLTMRQKKIEINEIAEKLMPESFESQTAKTMDAMDRFL